MEKKFITLIVSAAATVAVLLMFALLPVPVSGGIFFVLYFGGLALLFVSIAGASRP